MVETVHILIWGAGAWAYDLLRLLPDNCYVNAFIETEKKKNSFCGIEVISKEKVQSFYEMADVLIVAVNDYKEISKTIYSIIGESKRVFYFRQYGLNNEHKYFLHNGEYWELCHVFNKRCINALKEAERSPYVIEDCDGIRFLVNAQYHLMLRDLSNGKTYQQEDINTYAELMKLYYGIVPEDEKGYILDVGANIGTSSIWMKKCLFKNMKILAVEPYEENCRQFEMNCILNGIPKDEYILIRGALSDQNSIAQCMLSNVGNMGDNRILVNGNDKCNWEHVSVRLHRFDDWIIDNSFVAESIKFIWMDVQAHEAFAIDGMKKLLKSGAIPLYMEFWPVELRRNGSLEQLLDVLQSIYKEYICIRNYIEGDRSTYPIEDLRCLAEQLGDEFVDIFLIK